MALQRGNPLSDTKTIKPFTSKSRETTKENKYPLMNLFQVYITSRRGEVVSLDKLFLNCKCILDSGVAVKGRWKSFVCREFWHNSGTLGSVEVHVRSLTIYPRDSSWHLPGISCRYCVQYHPWFSLWNWLCVILFDVPSGRRDDFDTRRRKLLIYSLSTDTPSTVLVLSLISLAKCHKQHSLLTKETCILWCQRQS